MVSVSPVDGAVVWDQPDSSVSDVPAVMASAIDGFKAWKRTPVSDRDAVIRRFAELVGERRSELVNLISVEVGKTLSDADSEVGAIIGKAENSILARDELTGTHTKQLAAGALQVAHRPIGPVVVLGPFNFPGHLPNGHITPALLAGNSVVFKPSEQAPAVGEWMVAAWREVGLAENVLQIVHGGRSVAEALIDHPATAVVLFTGGVNAGRAIHERLAGRPEVLLALELGGNNPMIVWDVADLDAAARVVVSSAFLSSGQRCTCARRLIVPAGKQGDQIVAAVVEHTMAVTTGPPDSEPEPFMGPLISAEAAAQVLAAQNSLIEMGAKVLVQAQIGNDGPAYMTAGVLDVTGVPNRPDAEIFGPVLQVIRADSFEDAVEEANNTKFGLAAGVVTDNDDLWDRAYAELNAGIVNRNLPTVGASGAAPFGGTGASGNHRPAGYSAASYCAQPIASLTKAKP